MRPAIHFALYTLGLIPAETQTTQLERKCIANYCFGKQLAAEIGVWHGVTSHKIADNLGSGGILYSIDPYPKGRLRISFQKQVALRTLANVRNRVILLECTGETAAANLLQTLGCTFDFVFIDGDHSYDGLRRDWLAWSRMVREGGMLALHDSRSTSSRRIDDAGSVIFTKEVILQDRQFVLTDQVDSLSVLRRISRPTSFCSTGNARNLGQQSEVIGPIGH
jgi:predicted O-methyltransferase YrrM